jgi:hypothetical protein
MEVAEDKAIPVFQKDTQDAAHATICANDELKLVDFLHFVNCAIDRRDPMTFDLLF